MSELVLSLFAAFGLVFLIQQTDLMSGVRIWLLSIHPKLNSTVDKLLSCSYCLGFWISVVMYPLTHLHRYHPGEHFLFGFSGAAFCLLMSALIYKDESDA